MHTFYNSVQAPGYNALDSPTGRPLVTSAFVDLDVGGEHFVRGIIRKIDGTHFACLEEGMSSVPLAVRQRLRLRNGLD